MPTDTRPFVLEHLRVIGFFKRVLSSRTMGGLRIHSWPFGSTQSRTSERLSSVAMTMTVASPVNAVSPSNLAHVKIYRRIYEYISL